MKSAVILGIDPGYDRVGWAILHKSGSSQQLIACGCIQTSSQDEIFDRYQQITTKLHEICTEYSPTTLAIESLFFSKNKKTALRVSEAKGVIIGFLLEKGLTVHEYKPVQIKQAVTGNGQADKQAVFKMVSLQLKLPQKKLVDDVIDACAIGLTHVVLHKQLL